MENPKQRMMFSCGGSSLKICAGKVRSEVNGPRQAAHSFLCSLICPNLLPT